MALDGLFTPINVSVRPGLKNGSHGMLGAGEHASFVPSMGCAQKAESGKVVCQILASEWRKADYLDRQ